MSAIMNRSLIAATLLAGAAAIAQPAFAADLVSNDEHATVELGALANSPNIVGGGALTQNVVGANNTRTLYLQDNFAQQQPKGLVPVIVGSNNNDLRTIYVPADQAPRG